MDRETLLAWEKLNQLCLTEEEKQRVLDFSAGLKKGEELLNNKTEGFEPMVHLVDLTNVLREDVSVQEFSRDELQQSAPEEMDGYWQVPRLVE